MVAIPRPQRLTLPLATAGAAVGGALVGLLFLVMPSALLEALVTSSGVPAILAAAEPPLGLTARIALALVFGGGVALFAWFALFLVAGSRTVTLGGAAASDAETPILRRADAHPDAPPRRPLSANRDLGTPFLDVSAKPAPRAPEPTQDVQVEEARFERPLPINLEVPMAGYDPRAIRAEPLAPPPPVAPLKRPQLIDPGDRFETFELTPVRRDPPTIRVETSLREPASKSPAPPPPPVVAPQTEATIRALLDRLEAGVAQRETSARPRASGGLSDTLGNLRQLATGAR